MGVLTITNALPFGVCIGALIFGSSHINQLPLFGHVVLGGQRVHQSLRRCRKLHMDGCQNYGPLLGSLNTRCRIMIRTQKGTRILTTTHMKLGIGVSLLTMSLHLELLGLDSFGGLQEFVQEWHTPAYWTPDRAQRPEDLI